MSINFLMGVRSYNKHFYSSYRHQNLSTSEIKRRKYEKERAEEVRKLAWNYGKEVIT